MPRARYGSKRIGSKSTSRAQGVNPRGVPTPIGGPNNESLAMEGGTFVSLFTAEVKDADKQQAQVLSQGIQASLRNHAGKSVKRANEGNPVRWTLTTT